MCRTLSSETSLFLSPAQMWLTVFLEVAQVCTYQPSLEQQINDTRYRLQAEGPGSVGNTNYPSLQSRWYCHELLSHCLWNGPANHDLTRKHGSGKRQEAKGKGQKQNSMCKVSEINQQEESQGGRGWGEHKRKAAKQWEEVNFPGQSSKPYW